MALGAALNAATWKPGDLKPFHGDITADQNVQEPEPGFLYCNGAVVSQAIYPKLWNEIGSAYNTGGEGAGNFRLPDARDRCLLATGDTSARPRGTRAGSLAHTHTADHAHTQSHSHDQSHTHDMSHTHGHGSVSGDSGGAGAHIFVSGSSRGFDDHGHAHVLNTTSGASTSTTGGPSPSSTGADATPTGAAAVAGGSAVPTTDGQEAPHLVAGGLLVRYA